MVLSKYSGIPRVDLTREAREKWSGEIVLFFEGGELTRAERNEKPAPVVVNAKKEKAVK